MCLIPVMTNNFKVEEAVLYDLTRANIVNNEMPFAIG